jgi:anti-sigma factor RsiW
MLVAYVDDELDPAQRAAVEEAIRADPEAQAIVSVLKNSARAVKAAFDEPMTVPVPQRLLDVLQADTARSGGPPSGDVVVPFAPRRPVSAVTRYLLPLAASLAALAIGFGAGVGYDAGGSPIVPAGMTSPFENALMQALEHGDPGMALDYQDATAGVHGSVVVIGQVATSFNGACREFKHTAEGANTLLEYGVACRDADNAWQILTVSPRQPS